LSGPLSLDMLWSWIALFLGGLLMAAPANWKVIDRLAEDDAMVWGPIWMVVITGAVPFAILFNGFNYLREYGLNAILVWGSGFAAGDFAVSLYVGSAIVKEWAS